MGTPGSPFDNQSDYNKTAIGDIRFLILIRRQNPWILQRRPGMSSSAR